MVDRKFQKWLQEIDNHMQEHGMGYENAVRSGDGDEAIEKVWEDLYRRRAKPMDAIEKVFGDQDMRRNKFVYLYVLQGDYGYGWEDLCASEDRREVRRDLRDLQENEGGCYRIIQRRELNNG